MSDLCFQIKFLLRNSLGDLVDTCTYILCIGFDLKQSSPYCILAAEVDTAQYFN